jgi:hypothetical protein
MQRNFLPKYGQQNCKKIGQGPSIGSANLERGELLIIKYSHLNKFSRITFAMHWIGG